MTHSFRIQWHDPNTNYSGSFKGRKARGDDWKSLDHFTLSAKSSYDFHLSVVEGVDYVTFVSLAIDGTTFGAKVPPTVHDNQGDGDQDSIALGPLTLGTHAIVVKAAVLVSDDPKVQVTWGKGDSTNVATVGLIWTGSRGGWTDMAGGPIADPIMVEAYDQVMIEVRDESENVSTVAVYQAQRLVGELLEASLGQLGVTLTQPRGATGTTYTVNVFEPLSDTGRLAVG